MKNIGVVIVTHNSEKVLAKCLMHLYSGTIKPDKVIVVDNASKETSYLFLDYNDLEVILNYNNLGFCAANNLGYLKLRNKVRYVLFLNPDTFVTPNALELSLNFMNTSVNKNVGILSGKLLGYDLGSDKPNGRLDSTGILYTLYGRFYDRGQGEYDINDNDIEAVPAACGAFLFCKQKILENILIDGMYVFDQKYFMYKEDIDLCFRLSKKGYQTLYNPHIIVYHCRGWDKKRYKMPQWTKLLSLKNDWRLWKQHDFPLMTKILFLIYLLLKSFYVLVWENKKT